MIQIYFFKFTLFKPRIIKKQIPNIITLLNLLCGTIAVMLAATDRLVVAAFFVLLGIFFDFFDGLAARLLKAQSPLGVQLDSLADMVTSGVVPGVVMFQLLRRSIGDWAEYDWFASSFIESSDATLNAGSSFQAIQLLPFFGLLLTLGACYRLAKFNIDDRQTTSFIGLPTPAMALFVIALPLIHAYSNNEVVIDFINSKYFLIISTVVLVFLMNSSLELFSLKFKNFSLKQHLVEVIFLLTAIVLLVLCQFIAVPIIVLLFVLFSFFKKN